MVRNKTLNFQHKEMKSAATGTIIPIAADILFFITFFHTASSLPLSNLSFVHNFLHITLP